MSQKQTFGNPDAPTDRSEVEAFLRTGEYGRAARLLSNLMLEGETSELWNDWATAKFLAGQPGEAEGGYRRALNLHPGNMLAMANLGVLLAGQGRHIEAAPLLEIGQDQAKDEEKERLKEILNNCRKNFSRTGDEVNLQSLALRVANLETYLRRHLEDGSRQSSTDGRFAIYLGNDLALARVLDRFLMYVDTRDCSSAPHFLMYGFWEMWVTNVFQNLLRTGMNVVDVGANFGYYTLLAGSGVGPTGSVHAVEADPNTAALLRKTVAVNGFGWVRVHHCAAADKQGEVTLFQCNERQAGNGIVDFQHRRLDATVQIPAQPLDELIRDPVDVMKIDAEGSEPLIFEGMQELLKKSPNIQIVMEFAPILLRQTVSKPLDFLKRIRDAKFEYRVITEQSTLENWPDDKLAETDVSSLLLTHV